MFKLSEVAALDVDDIHLPGLSCTLLPNMSRSSLAPLRGEHDNVESHLKGFGLTFPGPTELTETPCIVLSLGQGQWLLQGELPDLAPVAEKAALTDQSDAWCSFELEGSKVPSMLERLVPTPPVTYSAGRAVRTQIEHIGCWVLGLSNNKWQLVAPRSSAESLFVSLKDAAEAVDALTTNYKKGDRV